MAICCGGRKHATHFRFCGNRPPANQEDLVNLREQKDLPSALKGADALVLAVRHKPYLDLDPLRW
jgi:hypothetical protein